MLFLSLQPDKGWCFPIKKVELISLRLLHVITGGNHTVMVTVESLGLASGDFVFTYDVTILSITPNNGSIAGKYIYLPLYIGHDIIIN